MMMFSFSNTILLRSVSTRSLVYFPILSNQRFKNFRSVFTFKITMKTFYETWVLSFHKSSKILKNWKKIKATFHRIIPIVTSKIINERNIVFGTSFSWNMRRSPYIIMHKIKKSNRKWNTFITWKGLKFCKFTTTTVKNIMTL